MSGSDRHHVAVDAGGTSTRAVLVRDDGTCVGYARAGSGNPIAAGPHGAGEAVTTAALGAVREARLEPTDVASVLAAMAGADTEGSTAWLTEPLARAGLPADVVIAADLLAAFLSGGREQDGYALVAGTGAIAVRVRDAHLDAVSDGLGWLLGDDGSGFWIGAAVVRAVLAALDGRRGPTALTPLVLAELGLVETPDRDENGQRVSAIAVTGRLYRTRPIELARFAPLAFAVPGDPAADAIVAEAGELLGATLRAVVAPDLPGPLVLGGSVLARQERLAAAVRAAWPGADVRTVDDGVVGTAVLALRRAGVVVDDAVHDRIVSSLAALRG